MCCQLLIFLFSNNEWVESINKETFSTVNPATGQKLLDFAHAKKEDIDKAVIAARKAFKTTWGNNVLAAERGACKLVIDLKTDLPDPLHSAK